MNKKLLVILAVLLCFSSLAYADVFFSDTFNRADSGTVGNGWAETEAGSNTVSISSNSMRLRTVDTGGTSPQSLRRFTQINNSDNLRVEFRVKASVTNSYAQTWIRNNADVIITRIDLINTGQIAIYTGGSYTNLQAYSANTWYNITMYDIDLVADTLKVRIDGVNYTNGGAGYAFDNNVADIENIICSNNKGVNSDAFWDFVNVTNTTVGNITPPGPLEFPYEEIDQLKQTTPVSVSSTTPVTVLTGTFTAEVGTPTYISYSGNIQPTQNPIGEQNCFLEINGNLVEGSNVTYSGASLNEHKSFYKLTNNFTTTQSSNTLDVFCYGSTNKNFNVLNNVIAIRGLKNTTDYNYTFSSIPGFFPVNNITDFQQIFTRTVNVTDFNITGTNKTIQVIFDVNNQLQYDITNTAEAYLVVDNITCPVIKRYGVLGETGSASYFCSKEITGQQNFTYTLFFKGDVNVDFQAFVKQAVLEDYEISNNFISDYLVANGSYVDIDSQNITVDAVTKDIFAIASLSLTANQANQESIFRFKIMTENGTIMYRDLNTINQAGVSTNQYLFTNLAVSNYTVTLQGLINATSPNTTIINGSVLYMAVGESDLSPTTFDIRATNIIFDNAISSFSASNGVTLSTSNGLIQYPKQQGLVNLTFIATNYFNTTVYNWNTSNNLNFNATPYAWINVTPVEFFSNTSITNFTINCSDYSTDTSTETNLLYQMEEDIDNVNVKCMFVHPDYATTTFNVTINSSVITQKYVQVFTSNSILMNFYDEDDLTLITANITVEVIGTTMSETNSTTTGSIYFDLLDPDSYTIRFVAPGYNRNLYFLTLENSTTQTLNFYMSKNTSTTAVTATVYDEKTLFVEDVRIKVLAEDPSNPSQFITTQMCDTNFEGRCELELQLNTKQYRFVLEYPIGTIKKITNPNYIFDTDITFQIIIGDLAGEQFINTKDVFGDVTFSPNTFTYIYNDPNNEITQGCLEIYTLDPTGKNLYSSLCSNSVSDTISLNILPVNGTTFIGKGSVFYDDNKVPIDDESVSYVSDKSNFGLNGAFLILFLLLTFGAIAMWNPVVFLLVLPLPLTLGRFAGFLDLPWYVFVGLHFLFIILAYVVSKRS